MKPEDLKSINLFGASGHARVVFDIIKANGLNIGCFYDDNPHYTEIYGIPVFKADETDVVGPLIICIGSCAARKNISNRYNIQYSTAIDPHSAISPTAFIDAGTVVMPGAIINAEAKIGRHCIINTKASIDHECRIGDYAHIAPGATLSGNVTVGECSWIGVGACVKQGVKIGRNCMIGAGAVVIEDIPDNMVAYGNPCKPIKPNISQEDVQTRSKTSFPNK